METLKTQNWLEINHNIYSWEYVDAITREIKEEAEYHLHNDWLILL